MNKEGKYFRTETIVTYLFIVILVGSGIVLLKFLGGGFTGFVVLQQGNQSNFDEGTYNNTAYNGNAVVLAGANLTGDYTSKIFDVNGPANWNNMSWTAGGYYSQELPDSGASENRVGGIDMSGNVLLMHMNDASGTIGDSSGKGNNGSYNGELYSQIGKLNTAIGFDGIDDTISVQDNESIEIDDITVSVWFNADSSPNGGEMFKRWGGAGNRVFQHYFLSNKHNFRLTDDGVNVDCNPQYSNTVTLDIWSHLVFTFDDTNDKVTIMVDGQNESFDCTISGLYTGSSQVINVGGSGIEFNGEIDEFVIWNRSLSVDEMLNLYKRGILRLNLTAKSCDDSLCSGESFIDIDNTPPQNLSLTDNRYFQYKVYFSSEDSSITPQLFNVTLDYSPLAPEINITSPQEGEGFNYNTSLPLNFTITNATSLDACWYTLNNGVSNTTVTNCQNTTFNANDGDYELRLYSNDTPGNIGSDSVNFTVSAVGVSLSISEPSGTKSSRTGIPITFSAVGNNLTCWYNVKTSIGGDVIGNTTLANCSDSNFAVSSDSDYVFNLFANNSLGVFNSKTSSFSISTSSSSPPSSGGGGGGGSSGGTTIIQTTGVTTELTVDPIFGFIANPGESKTITWGIKNTGTIFLNDCGFESFGDHSSWVSGKETKSLSAGEEYEFVFDLNIPEGIGSGSYELGVVSNCKETSGSTKFNVEIIEKKLQLELLEITRENGRVRINYLLEEFSGIDQNVDLEFLLFDGNEKVAELLESKSISANSKNEFESFINVGSSLEGNLNLLINLNSEVYSTFLQENIILGSKITGFTVFGNLVTGDSIIGYVMIFLFFIFAVVIIKRIFNFRKILKHQKKGSKIKKKTGKKK